MWCWKGFSLQNLRPNTEPLFFLLTFTRALLNKYTNKFHKTEKGEMFILAVNKQVATMCDF